VTISEPFVVGMMTQLLEAGRRDSVLEIGTGSGYQAAVLAQLAGPVYTIEIVPALARSAAALPAGRAASAARSTGVWGPAGGVSHSRARPGGDREDSRLYRPRAHGHDGAVRPHGAWAGREAVERSASVVE